VADARAQGSVWIYTGMRILLFLGIWLLLQLLTPLRGLWGIAAAILMSGLISIFVLNRQRDAMSSTVGAFFRRINDRIDASARAEDFDDAPVSDETELLIERNTDGQDEAKN
jgi:hypothetical protein